MFRNLLKAGGGADLIDSLELFKDRPGLLEKYVLARDLGLEVLDLLLSRLFGAEGEGASSNENRAGIEAACDSLASGAGRVRGSTCAGVSGRAEEQSGVIDEIKQQLQDQQRQILALQRQLQTQGDVSRVASSLGDAMSDCQSRVAENEEAVRDLSARFGGIHGELAQLKEREARRVADGVVGALRREVAEKGRQGELRQLVEDAASQMARDGSLGRLHTKLKGLLGEFHFTGLNGIIAHLTRECGGNVAEKGEVAVTASTVGGGDLKNVVDLETDSHFYTESKPDSWICYDFKGRRVTPTSYSIKSWPLGPGLDHPKSWVLEVSDDGSERSWLEVDRRDNNNDLNDKSVTRNFPIASVAGRRFRFIRLRLTGKNHDANDHLHLSALEVFGTLSRE